MNIVRAAAVLLALGAGPLAVHPQVAPQDPPPALPEYVVKAGFLFNFAKYVEWPPDAFESADAPFSIGIVGTDPFGDELDKTLRNKTVKDRPFVVRRYARPEDIGSVHILFVPQTEGPRRAKILKGVGTKPVLTVGEEGGFAKSGGVIDVVIENEKPRLEVNPEAAAQARLVINAKLLKVATIVKTEK